MAFDDLEIDRLSEPGDLYQAILRRMHKFALAVTGFAIVGACTRYLLQVGHENECAHAAGAMMRLLFLLGDLPNVSAFVDCRYRSVRSRLSLYPSDGRAARA